MERLRSWLVGPVTTGRLSTVLMAEGDVCALALMDDERPCVIVLLLFKEELALAYGLSRIEALLIQRTMSARNRLLGRASACGAVPRHLRRLPGRKRSAHDRCTLAPDHHPGLVVHALPRGMRPLRSDGLMIAAPGR